MKSILLLLLLVFFFLVRSCQQDNALILGWRTYNKEIMVAELTTCKAESCNKIWKAEVGSYRFMDINTFIGIKSIPIH